MCRIFCSLLLAVGSLKLLCPAFAETSLVVFISSLSVSDYELENATTSCFIYLFIYFSKPLFCPTILLLTSHISNLTWLASSLPLESQPALLWCHLYWTKASVTMASHVVHLACCKLTMRGSSSMFISQLVSRSFLLGGFWPPLGCCSSLKTDCDWT